MLNVAGQVPIALQTENITSTITSIHKSYIQLIKDYLPLAAQHNNRSQAGVAGLFSTIATALNNIYQKLEQANTKIVNLEKENRLKELQLLKLGNTNKTELSSQRDMAIAFAEPSHRPPTPATHRITTVTLRHQGLKTPKH